MGWMTVSSVAKAAVAGAFIALPALALPALAQAAPANDVVCVVRTATTCYYLIPPAPQTTSDVSTEANAYSWDDDSYGDSGGGGAAGGGG